MAQRAVEPAPVVRAFDVFEEGASDPILGPGLTFRHGLTLERAPERFHGSVVVAVTLATHAGHQARSLKSVSIALAGILNASIGMMDEPFGRPPLNQCALQRLDSAASVQALPNGPAQNLAAVEIHYCCQEHPTFRAQNVGDIGDPNLVRSSRRCPAQQ